MIDNIVTNTMLPALARGVLQRSVAREKLAGVTVGVEGGDFTYAWR
jgi:type VI secretion system protein VasG